MALQSRRRYLALVCGGFLAGGLAGCSDQESEFVVTNTQLVHRDGDDRFDYPDDVLVRVTIENSFAERQEGTLELTLIHHPGGDDSREETWEKRDQISLPQGTSTIRRYVFEDVFEPGNDIGDYTLEATIG